MIMKNLINWSEVSRILCDIRTTITEDYSGIKYQEKCIRVKNVEKALRTYLETKIKYNQQNIKKYKSYKIRLDYLSSGKPNSIIGKIKEDKKNRILFKINTGDYIYIAYRDIKMIEIVKSFDHHIKIIKKYMQKRKFQKALNKLDLINNKFNLDFQIKELERLRNDCINNLWNQKGLKKAIQEEDIMNLRETLKIITDGKK